MKTIFKYQLVVEDSQTIKIPKGGDILSLQVQHGIPCLWILVDTEQKEKESRVFEMYGTGHIIHDYNKKYIGTFIIRKGLLVFHVFERIES